MVTQQFKDGKPYTAKPKSAPKRKIEKLVSDQYSDLLQQKMNLIKDNIADEFLDIKTRDKKIYERAVKLANLHPFEMLIRLAATEIRLETTLFLYDETYNQKQFLEKSYLDAVDKRFANAASKVAGKSKKDNKYTFIKQFAQNTLGQMDKKDFKVFCRKIRVKFPISEISDGALRNYYKEITGLESTK